MEDLYANKRLRKKYGAPYHMAEQILVSSRRYEKRGQLQQIMRNLYIFACYALGKGNVKVLRSVHEQKRKVSQ